MKSIFIGYFRPTQEEFDQLWKKCIFAVDANVLLNLYRYSPATRKELEKALKSIQERVFIPHQAAREYLKNRLNVTAGQASEYLKTINSIKELLSTLSSKDRHPFLPDPELPKFTEYSQRLVSILESQKDLLLEKLTEDEILDFVGKLFSGKTGQSFDDTRLNEIEKEGVERYQREIPPGYKDAKKDSADDPYRKYGDLIVWMQIIEYAKSQNKPVVFITDDKKEDWWLEQSGRTIGPRPEIIEEFYVKTNQRFWMYTVERFIKESARITKTDISEEVLKEIIKISLDAQENTLDGIHSIELSQEIIKSDEEIQEGFLYVTLNKPMRYATGTGKFSPRFSKVPEFEVDLIDSPYEDMTMVGLSYGCGTTRDFNVHLRGKKGLLLSAGTYVFKYKAYIKEAAQSNQSETIE